ncbi:DUF45 domain-containing protein [bacterium]|nr:DUF45 domain-containing protein [bacterium]
MPVGDAHRVFLTAATGDSVPLRLHVDRRARRVSVRIDPYSREAVATVPAPRHTLDAIAFANEKVDWIAERLDALPRQVSFRPGAFVPLRGTAHRLKRVDTGRVVKVDRTAGPSPLLLVPGPPETFSAKTRAFFRNAARLDFQARVSVHAAALGVAPTSISIKDTRSRWGSCSSTGRLNFSWRLVCAPPFVLDYVAAHEVAHLREMSHSRRFWSLVETCIPDWSPARDWLRDRGPALHAVGDAS